LPPVQWQPQEPPRFTSQAAAGWLVVPAEEVKTEKLLDSLVDPQ